MRKLFSMFTAQEAGPRPEIDAYATIDKELKLLNTQFTHSRTGVEMYDLIKQREEEETHQPIPATLETYNKNRLRPEQYEELDEELLRISSSPNISISDFREETAKLKYANCTNLACFMHEALTEHGIESRIFGIGGAHHFVIATDKSTPNQLIVADPWAGTQFRMNLPPRESLSLDGLTAEDRILIAKRHYKHTKLYPDYKEKLEELLAQDPNCSPDRANEYCKLFFEIAQTNRFYEFSETDEPSPIRRSK